MQKNKKLAHYLEPEILTLTLGELDSNCYLVSCPDTQETIIIDPGDDGSFISEKILELKLKPLCMVFTHGHFDHVLGSLELRLNFDLPIFLHKNDNFLVKDAQKSAIYWLKKHEVAPVPSEVSFISKGQILEFGKCQLEVIETPGHTPGSISLVSTSTTTIIFTGDTLFKNSVGRTDFKYSKPLELEKSLQKLFSYPKETLCYPGHGESTTIEAESQI
ncbi:MBL fold metallo-hydrolase [Patescibacteria group bacterium]|nr:MBL fold metallo-hydrolase [Patescibacteria group bacterium]